jgi:hypothetical protein
LNSFSVVYLTARSLHHEQVSLFKSLHAYLQQKTAQNEP